MATRANKVEVEITASDEASPKIDKLANKIDGLEADEARVTVTANTDRLEKQLAAAKQKLEQLDGDEATVQARLVGTIEKDLKDARDLFEQLDGKTGKVTLNADTSQLDAGLDESASKIDSLGDLAGNLPGPLGEAAGLLSGPGGIAGGAAAAGAGLLAMAKGAADTALEAQTIADLTGATVEDASRWLSLTKQAGIEYGDLADIVGQVGQVLAQTPELAKQLGININDGKDGLERIVQVLDQVNANTDNATERANLLGQLFGEQGVRQVQALATAVGGDLKKALDGVSDKQIISPEDVKRAREFRALWARVSAEIQGVVLAIGQDLIPILNVAADIVGEIDKGLGELPGDLSILKVSEYLSPWHQLTDAIGLAGDEINKLRGKDVAGGQSQLVAAVLAQTEDLVASTVELTRETAQQALARAAANEQMQTYLDLLSQRGDEAAEEKRVTDQVEQHYDALADVNEEAERVDRARIVERERTAVQRVRDEYRKLRDDLSDRKSLLQLQGQFDDLREKAVDAWGAAAAGAEDAEAKERDYQIAQLDTIDNALAYIETLDNIPASVVTDVEALIDQGKYNEALNKLEILSKPRTAELKIHLDEVALQRQLAAWYARNNVNPLTAPRSVAPMAGGGPATVVNVNMPRGSRGVDVLNQITNQTRRSGRRYGTPTVSYARTR